MDRENHHMGPISLNSKKKSNEFKFIQIWTIRDIVFLPLYFKQLKYTHLNTVKRILFIG